MLVSDIATLLNYEMVGDDYDINGISWYDEAREEDIAVITKSDDIFSTRAKVVLTKPIILPTNKTFLITYENVECALVKICNVFIKNNLMHDFSIPTKYVLTDYGYHVGENCKIGINAVVQPNVFIGDNVIIGDYCVIEPFTLIGSGTVIGTGVHIGSGSRIGVPSFYHYYEDGVIYQFGGCGIVKIGEYTHIGNNTIVQRGTISNTIIGNRCMIGNCIDIGHDVKIGNNCKIVSQVGIAGNSMLKNDVVVYGQAGITNNVVIGNNVIVKAKTSVCKSIDDNEVIGGAFGRSYIDEMKLTAKIRQFFTERKREI